MSQFEKSVSWLVAKGEISQEEGKIQGECGPWQESRDICEVKYKWHEERVLWRNTSKGGES